MAIWTARARADLKAIHDYIAKDSSINAKRVVREMHRKATGLAETPLLGRVVRELDDRDIREIPAAIPSASSKPRYPNPPRINPRTKHAPCASRDAAPRRARAAPRS